MNIFADKLEYQRLKNNFSKGQLSHKLGISRQILYNYLGGRNPNWELIQTIQSVFPKISMDYWINDSISIHDDFVKLDNRVEENISNNQFEILNRKLDMIINILDEKSN